jgi:hypothetical protein
MGAHRPAKALARSPCTTDPRPADSVNEDFLDMLRALAEAGARFVVVGAHAMAVHGVPRATQDLDVLIDPERANAERVWKALGAFGAPLQALGITQADLATTDLVIQIGVPASRIDLLTGISGVTFEAAWGSRVEQSIGAISVAFLGRDTLIANKRATGRRKDLGDLEALGALPPGS